MYQLKPFKQYIYYRDEQIDGMNDIYNKSAHNRLGR